jgi:hypothetical protein
MSNWVFLFLFSLFSSFFFFYRCYISLSTSWCSSTQSSTGINLPFVYCVCVKAFLGWFEDKKNLSVFTHSIDLSLSKFVWHMPSIFYSLIFLFLTNTFIEPTTCDLPAYLQNLELDDITSLWDKFPSIINQIKQAGMLLRNVLYEGRWFFLSTSFLYVLWSFVQKKLLSRWYITLHSLSSIFIK